MCNNYCGITCVNGYCPKIEDNKYTCEECIYNKQCDDCCFYDTEICNKDNYLTT